MAGLGLAFNALINWARGYGQAAALVFPTLANEVSVVGAAGAWAQGAWAQLASTVGSADVVVTHIHVVTVTGIHQIQLGMGASGSEVGGGSFSFNAVGTYPIPPYYVAAASRLAARTASKAGGSQACTIKLVCRPI